MGKYVIRSAEVPTYSPEGHLGTVNRNLISKKNIGAEHMEVVLGMVAAEGATEAHSHQVEQAQYILEGKAYVEIDGEEGEKVGAGDMVFFPVGKTHRITAVGGPFKCLVIYAPPRAR